MATSKQEPAGTVTGRSWCDTASSTVADIAPSNSRNVPRTAARSGRAVFGQRGPADRVGWPTTTSSCPL